MDYKLNIEHLLEQDSEEMLFDTHALYTILESCYNVMKEKIILDLDDILNQEISYGLKLKAYRNTHEHQLLRLRNLMLCYSQVLIITLETDREYLLQDYNELVDTIDINNKLVINANHFYKRDDLLNLN